jgi:hypothetical protein
MTANLIGSCDQAPGVLGGFGEIASPNVLLDGFRDALLVRL